jgi:hypothetical protein
MEARGSWENAMVRVQTNNGEVAVLMEDDGKTVYRYRSQINVKSREAGVPEISRDEWLKTWPAGKTCGTAKRRKSKLNPPLLPPSR